MSDKTPVLRFAPSPTGAIHIGNLRTALINWLYARKTGGQFILRLDDTDTARSTEAFAQGIRDDLTWMGLEWDREEKQSTRFDLYGDVVAQLKRDGRIYPCFETEDELNVKRARLRARNRPPIYDRAALKLSDDDRAKLEADGRRPHWRFLLNNFKGDDHEAIQPTPVTWTDLVRGEQTVDLGSLSDPVLIREDESYLYTLCSVIDDIDFGITHVVRGEDHVTNSGVQVQIFEALGARPPEFAHHSLLIGADGKGLSKRLGSLSINGFAQMGLEPMAVASHAALIGSSDALAPYATLDELADLFAFSKLSRAPGRFDLKELEMLNARLLHQLPYSAVADRLAGLGIPNGEAFWDAVHGNLETFADCAAWWRVVNDAIDPIIEDRDFCAKAAGLLPDEPWGPQTWGDWTKTVKTETGRKGRALFHPLRLALTGRDTGPELKALLPLIGRTKALHRLEAS